jgi:hypothetical protein
LDEAFRALDEDDEEPQRRSDFKLAIEEDDEPDTPPDDDSLDALIADTKQDLEPVSAESEEEDEGDALDRVLGEDLPDPPSDDDFDFGSNQDFRPAGARQNTPDDDSEHGRSNADEESADSDEASEADSAEEGEQKGFLSRFFGGDD